MKRSALTALALVSALALTGCGGSDDEPAAGASPSAVASDDVATDAAAETTDTGPGIISPELPDVPEFEVGPQGIIDDVTVDACSTEPGTVTASGTATNAGQFQRDLVVAINWAVTSTSDVLARGVTALDDVPPGETRDWEVSAELPEGETVACVPTAYAGQLP